MSKTDNSAFETREWLESRYSSSKVPKGYYTFTPVEEGVEVKYIDQFATQNDRDLGIAFDDDQATLIAIEHQKLKFK